MGFYEKYLKTREEKESILCIGLDPATKEQRKEDVMPEKYNQNIIQFCIDIIEETGEHACAFKINSQYMLFTTTLKEQQELNKTVKKAGCLSILDHKLGDISSTNNAAMYWIRKAGYDAFTYSPFPGNIHKATAEAHNNDLGIFVLTLMTNPEAETYQKKAHVEGVSLYEKIAFDSRNADADGLVVGTTSHINESDLMKIKALSGENTIYLNPGVGKQQGDIGKVYNILGENLLINVSRAIIYDQSPEKKADEYKTILKR